MFSKHQDQARTRYGGKFIVVHCPPEMREAVDQAAEQEMCSASAYVRRAVRDRLRADGLLGLDKPVA